MEISGQLLLILLIIVVQIFEDQASPIDQQNDNVRSKRSPTEHCSELDPPMGTLPILNITDDGLTKFMSIRGTLLSTVIYGDYVGINIEDDKNRNILHLSFRPNLKQVNVNNKFSGRFGKSVKVNVPSLKFSEELTVDILYKKVSNVMNFQISINGGGFTNIPLPNGATEPHKFSIYGPIQIDEFCL